MNINIEVKIESPKLIKHLTKTRFTIHKKSSKAYFPLNITNADKKIIIERTKKIMKELVEEVFKDLPPKIKTIFGNKLLIKYTEGLIVEAWIMEEDIKKGNNIIYIDFKTAFIFNKSLAKGFKHKDEFFKELYNNKIWIKLLKEILAHELRHLIDLKVLKKSSKFYKESLDTNRKIKEFINKVPKELSILSKNYILFNATVMRIMLEGRAQFMHNWFLKESIVTKKKISEIFLKALGESKILLRMLEEGVRKDFELPKIFTMYSIGEGAMLQIYMASLADKELHKKFMEFWIAPSIIKFLLLTEKSIKIIKELQDSERIIEDIKGCDIKNILNKLKIKKAFIGLNEENSIIPVKKIKTIFMEEAKKRRLGAELKKAQKFNKELDLLIYRIRN